MAVEIPVVVDIDKAFTEAAKRVSSAMQPLKHSIEDNTAKIQLKIGTRYDDLSQTWVPVKKSLEDIIGLTSKVNNKTGTTTYNLASSTKELNVALEDAKQKYANLSALEEKGVSIDYKKLDAAREAITVLMSELSMRQRKVSMVEQATKREIDATAAIEKGNYALIQETKTAADLNDKISSLRAKLQNLDPKSKEWTNTAKEIKKAVAELGKYEAKLDKILSGTSTRTSAGSINRINKEMNELVSKWNSMSSKLKFDANGQLSAKANEMVQKYRELAAESERYGRSLQATAMRAVPAVENVSQKLRTQSGIFRMLTSYMSIYTAIFAGMRFIRNIRETTAEFEMQRVALGGIIQDAEKANSLFREIKAAAIESPFQIKDLVKYTKQLSAYRIATEDLFKVTMKLADVSAGLGVDMNRLILAYGQVRAAAVLRGQELRQFTEAGIPMVELLAKKFQELGREGTTTADVFELISKRAVPFSMIADIFDDMTERGGVFYKMQEKQAETLKGQWSNLKDSLSIMYDEIGNTSAVHGAMTTLINDAKFLFQNWRYIANAIKISASSFVAFKAVSLFLPNLKRELVLTKKAQDAFTRSQQLSAFAADTGSRAALSAAARLKAYGVIMEQAALQTNFFKRAWLQLKAIMAATSWISLVLTALSALATVFVSIRMESGRLEKELRKIGVEGQTSINRSVANFQRLADAAVNAADGSKEQADAIDELKRTYGDIIPSHELQSEKLRQLAGDYSALTAAIRQKISEQIREQQVNAITDEYGKTIGRKQKKTKDLLASYGLDKEQINAVMSEIQEAVRSGMITIESTAYERRDAFQTIIKDLTGFVVDLGSGFRDLSGRWQNVSDLGEAEKSLNALTDSYIKMETAINGVDNSMEVAVGTFGKFAKMAKDMEKDVSNVFVGPEFGDRSSYASQQQKIKQTVQVYWDYIVKAFEEANKTSDRNIDIGRALLGDGKIDFSFINEAVKEAMEGGKNTRLNTFISSIQQEYEKLIPSDRVVNLVREKVRQIADQFSVPMDKAHMYFKDSETSMEDWVKGLQEAQKEHASLAAQMKLNNQEIEAGTIVLKAFSQAEIDAEDNMSKFLETLIEFFGEFRKKQPHSAYQQDPFIGQMQERIKFMQDFKKGYEDLNKYIGSNDALAKISEKMAARGLSLGIDESQQKRAASELSQWYSEAMEEAFKEAKKHGATGRNIQEFLSKAISDNTNSGKAQKEFQKLIQSLFDAKTDLDTSTLKKQLDDELKQLKDEIKHSETAKNFMNEIFDLTGNKQLATDLAISVYGNPGDDLEKNIQNLLAKSFIIDEDKLPENFEMPNISEAIQKKDVITLRKMLQYIVDDNKQAAEDILSNWEKEEADWLKNLYKTYEKAKTFEERKDLIRDRATAARNRINSDTSLSQAEKTSMLKAVDKQEARDIADVEAEALKTTYEWISAFKDMERVSSETLKELIRLLDDYIEKNKETASPESLKTLMQAKEQAHAQLVERNGYANLVKSAGKYYAAQKKLNALKKDGKKGTVEYRKALDEEREALIDMQKSVKAVGDSFESLSSMVSSVSDILDLDELSDGRAVLEGIATGLSLVGTALVFINAMFEMLKTNPIVLALSAIIAGIAALASILNNLKVAKANREIEKQNKLLHELEYNYDKLGKAIEKAFGSEYIYNYTKQLEVLSAKQAAYNAQAQAERSKGKKSDADKIQEYEDSARDAADQIAEMKSQLSEFFAGTDLTSAAEDFAGAWIDAYKEFSSTTDAMSEKFNDMIQSMINKSLAAKIMQEMLQPIFDQIDELAKDGLLSTNDIAEIAALAQSRIPLINDAMTNLMTGLAAAGLDVRNATAGFHGISKEIAGASEEAILGLAAGINTQNFYMSYMPVISENVAQILAAMTGGVSPTAPVATTETGEVMPSVQQMVYDHLPNIDQRLANLESLFRSVITAKGSSTNTNFVAVR